VRRCKRPSPAFVNPAVLQKLTKNLATHDSPSTVECNALPDPDRIGKRADWGKFSRCYEDDAHGLAKSTADGTEN